MWKDSENSKRLKHKSKSASNLYNSEHEQTHLRLSFSDLQSFKVALTTNDFIDYYHLDGTLKEIKPYLRSMTIEKLINSQRTAINLMKETPFLTFSYIKQLLIILYEDHIKVLQQQWLSQFTSMLDVIFKNVGYAGKGDEEIYKKKLFNKLKILHQHCIDARTTYDASAFAYEKIENLIQYDLLDQTTTKKKYITEYTNLKEISFKINIGLNELLNFIMENKFNIKAEGKSKKISEDNYKYYVELSNSLIAQLMDNHTELNDLAKHPLFANMNLNIKNDSKLIQILLNGIFDNLIKLAKVFKKEKKSEQKELFNTSVIATTEPQDYAKRGINHKPLLFLNEKIPTLLAWLEYDKIGKSILNINSNIFFWKKENKKKKNTLHTRLQKTMHKWVIQETAKLQFTDEIRGIMWKLSETLQKNIASQKTLTVPTIPEIFNMMLTLLCFPNMDILYKINDERHVLLQNHEPLLKWLSLCQPMTIEFVERKDFVNKMVAVLRDDQEDLTTLMQGLIDAYECKTQILSMEASTSNLASNQ